MAHKYSQPDIVKIGERVSEQRKAAHVSQNKLGNGIGVHKDVIQRIESGKLKDVNTEHLRLIAHCLHCNEGYFLLSSDNPDNPHVNDPLHFELPEFQHTVEAFVYHDRRFRTDIEYMLRYMHPEFQDKILDILHTMVLLHQSGVHYPNTTPDVASSRTLKDIEKERKDNFFESITL